MASRLVRSAFACSVALAAAVALAPAPRAAADTLPDSLSDADFWALTQQVSEPNGYFGSDNLTSNEILLSAVAARLAERTKPGGVYLGVGPEQNFSYIAAMRPKMAFINDIRRGNLHMHLMYKALFELAAERAEFVSLLFTKKRPDGVGRASSAAELMNAQWSAPTLTDGTYDRNLAAVIGVLTKTHKLPLSAEDLAGIATLYHTFYWCGPAINYAVRAGSATCGTVGDFFGDWSGLMTTVDVSGLEHSFLASEEAFAIVKALHARNLIVPTVGDFAGPKALRAIASYLKAHDATLSAFYVSNVEGYLQQNGVWQTFCNNVSTMPLDELSVFIRPIGTGVSTRTVGTDPPPMLVGAGVALIIPPDGGRPRLQRIEYASREPLTLIAEEIAANHCTAK